MRHQLLQTALLLACISLSFPHAYAMEELSDDEIELFSSYISPGDLGLSEIILEAQPHKCPYCNSYQFAIKEYI